MFRRKPSPQESKVAGDVLAPSKMDTGKIVKEILVEETQTTPAVHSLGLYTYIYTSSIYPVLPGQCQQETL